MGCHDVSAFLSSADLSAERVYGADATPGGYLFISTFGNSATQRGCCGRRPCPLAIIGYFSHSRAHRADRALAVVTLRHDVTTGADVSGSQTAGIDPYACTTSRGIHGRSQPCQPSGMRSRPAPSRPTLANMPKHALGMGKLFEHHVPAPGTAGVDAAHHQVGARGQQRQAAAVRAPCSVRSEGRLVNGAELGWAGYRVRGISGGQALRSGAPA